MDRFVYFGQISAGVAQLVEQRFCKPQVVGSSPFSSSIFEQMQFEMSGKWIEALIFLSYGTR